MNVLTFTRLHVGAVVLAGGFASCHPANAQTCASPWAVAANTTYAFDTCQGDTSLSLACGVIPLAGAATVVSLDLPYPAGSVSVQSMDANYSPTAFLLRASCNSGASCSDAVAASPGTVGTIDFSRLDSGRYFLVVAADANAGGASCGHVAVTVHVTPEQEELMRQGVFRDRILPVWQPPSRDARDP